MCEGNNLECSRKSTARRGYGPFTKIEIGIALKVRIESDIPNSTIK